MAIPSPAANANNPDFLFEALVGKLRGATSEVHQRITAHVREVSGHSTLPAFHNNGATAEEKCACYRVCLKAVLTGDYSTLKGVLPAGQAKATEKPAAKEPEKPKEAESQPEAPTPQQETKPAAAAAQSTVQVTQNGAVEGAVKNLLELLSQQKQQPTVDESLVRQICEGMYKERLKEMLSEAMSKVDDYLSKVPARDVLQIKKWDGTITEIKERYHKQLPQIIKAISSRNASGMSEFLYIWGAAGAGKTYMLMQLGKALGVKHYPYPMGPTATEGKILGFNNIANGSFVKGWLYEPYKNGGIVGLDEIALADGSVLAGTNSIENDEFTFGNGETVKRHKDFYLVAFDNTLGTGATGGFVRNKLDAATLDRFTVIELEYDEELEKAIYGNAKWAEYVIKVRHHVRGTMNGLHITPRATRKGAALLANGVSPVDVCNWTVFRMMSKEQKATTLATIGLYKP